MTAYNTISLFSGAMGLDLGIEKAGFKYGCAWRKTNGPPRQ